MARPTFPLSYRPRCKAYHFFAVPHDAGRFLTRSVFAAIERADSKAAGAWAIPTALPSSPIQLPSFGTHWASGLENLPKAAGQRESQPDRRIIFAESGRL